MRHTEPVCTLWKAPHPSSSETVCALSLIYIRGSNRLPKTYLGHQWRQRLWHDDLKSSIEEHLEQHQLEVDAILAPASQHSQCHVTVGHQERLIRVVPASRRRQKFNAEIARIWSYHLKKIFSQRNYLPPRGTIGLSRTSLYNVAGSTHQEFFFRIMSQQINRKREMADICSVWSCKTLQEKKIAAVLSGVSATWVTDFSKRDLLRLIRITVSFYQTQVEYPLEAGTWYPTRLSNGCRRCLHLMMSCIVYVPVMMDPTHMGE